MQGLASPSIIPAPATTASNAGPVIFNVMRLKMQAKKQQSDPRYPTCFVVATFALAILTMISIVAFRYLRVAGVAYEDAARMHVNLYKHTIDEWQDDHDSRVTNESDFQKIIRSRLYAGANVTAVDPWDSPYRFQRADGRYKIWSYGRDRENGTNDDIVAWGD